MQIYCIFSNKFATFVQSGKAFIHKRWWLHHYCIIHKHRWTKFMNLVRHTYLWANITVYAKQTLQIRREILRTSNKQILFYIPAISVAVWNIKFLKKCGVVVVQMFSVMLMLVTIIVVGFTVVDQKEVTLILNQRNKLQYFFIFPFNTFYKK